MGVSQKFFLQSFGAFFVGNVKTFLKLSTELSTDPTFFLINVKSTRRVFSKKVERFSLVLCGIQCREQLHTQQKLKPNQQSN
jgi:hypothetical protein